MKKYFIAIVFAALSVLTMIPASVYAETAIEIIDNDNDACSVSVTPSKKLHVYGFSSSSVVYIYNITGHCVAHFKVEGSDRYFDLNLPKGCYIVKIGDYVRRIVIK